MKRLREVLINQYIGAIAIGFLLAKTMAGAITGLIGNVINYYFAVREDSRLMGAPSVFPWNALIISLVAAAVELVVALLLMRWLYAPAEDGDQDSGNASAESVAP